MIFVMTFSLVIVQEMAARMGAVTGKGFAALIRERFGVRPTLFAMIVPAREQRGHERRRVRRHRRRARSCSASRSTSRCRSPRSSCGCSSCAAATGNVEKLLLVLSSVFLAYVVAAFMAKPDWGVVLKATVVPHVHPDDRLRAHRHRDHRHDDRAVDAVLRAEQHRGQGRRPSKTCSTSASTSSAAPIAANIVAWFIIVTTGTVLFPRGIHAASAEKAALALAPVAGQYASALFAIGLFGASLLAAFVLPLTAAYAVTEAFGFERGIDRTLGRGAGLQRHLHLRHRLRRRCSC